MRYVPRPEFLSLGLHRPQGDRVIIGSTDAVDLTASQEFPEHYLHDEFRPAVTRRRLAAFITQ